MSLNDGLIHAWKLDETSGTRYDSVGDWHLTDYNTVGSTAGVSDLAAHFEGANAEYLSRNTVFSLDNFTVSAWINPSELSIGNNTPAIVVFNGSPFFRIRLGSNNTIVVEKNSSNQIRITSPFSTVNQWVHVCFTEGSTEGILYLDGVPVGSSPPGGYSGFTSISVSQSSSFFRFTGAIDEICIWDRALSPSEIPEFFGEGAGSVIPFVVTPVIAPVTSQNISFSVSLSSAKVRVQVTNQSALVKPSLVTIRTTRAIVLHQEILVASLPGATKTFVRASHQSLIVLSGEASAIPRAKAAQQVIVFASPSVTAKKPSSVLLSQRIEATLYAIETCPSWFAVDSRQIFLATFSVDPVKAIAIGTSLAKINVSLTPLKNATIDAEVLGIFSSITPVLTLDSRLK